MLFILFIIFAALQVFDLITSYYCFSKGYGREANPVVGKLMDAIGLLPALVAVKAIAVLAGVVIYESKLLLAPHGLALLIILYLWVVWNNVDVIIRAKLNRNL